jgi:hypothetical protein
LKKPFDTSGKSAARIHHRASFKTADGSFHRAPGAITTPQSPDRNCTPARKANDRLRVTEEIST